MPTAFSPWSLARAAMKKSIGRYLPSFRLPRPVNFNFPWAMEMKVFGGIT